MVTIEAVETEASNTTAHDAARERQETETMPVITKTTSHSEDGTFGIPPNAQTGLLYYDYGTGSDPFQPQHAQPLAQQHV